MIKQQCADKGFDAVETDLDETYNDNEGTTPWTITESNEQTYLTTLADYMHSLGLGWIAKDLDDTATASPASWNPWPRASSPSSATSTNLWAADQLRGPRGGVRCGVHLVPVSGVLRT